MKRIAAKLLSASLSALVILQLVTPCLSAEASSEARTIVFGDVNYDQRISLKDASKIQKYELGLSKMTDEQLFLADINGDDTVSLMDAYLLQQYATDMVHSGEKNPKGYAIGDVLTTTEPYIPEIPDDTDESDDTDDQDTASDTDSLTDIESDTDNGGHDNPDTTTDTDTISDIETDENTDTLTEETDTSVIDDSEETDTFGDDPVTDTSTEEEPDTESDPDIREDYIEPFDILSVEQLNDNLNGGFELGNTYADNWGTYDGNPNAKIIKGSGVSGSNAIGITNSSNYTSFTINNLSGLEPGADYKLTAKIKGENVACDKNQNGAWVDVGFCVHYAIAKFDKGTSVLGRGSNIYSENNWKTGTFDWSEATVYFVPDIFGCADVVCALSGSGTAYFDELTVERIDDFNTAQNGAIRYLRNHTALVMHREDVMGYDQTIMNQWADEIDEGFDQITDLVGARPGYGDVVYIISSEEPHLIGVQAYGAITPIQWIRGYAANNAKNRVEKGVRSQVPFHELGHNFDTIYGWTFYGESSADFMATYVSALHPDDLYDFRGWGYQFYKYEDFIQYIKSEDSNCYDTIIVQQKGDYYVTALNYVLWRSVDSDGFDVLRKTLHYLRDNSDPKYASSKGKFMYLMMLLQENYNETHTNATGREIYDSFPEGEFEHVKDVIHNLSGWNYTEDQEIYSVQFKDIDGSSLGFDFVPFGSAAKEPTVPDSPEYGRFIRWSSDTTSVSSNMTVTPVYENSPNVSAAVKNADDSSEVFACGDFADVSITSGSSDLVSFRVTCGDYYDSGYTSDKSFRFMLKNAGQVSILIYAKTSEGKEVLAGNVGINVKRAVTVYYSGFSSPYIHYCPDGGSWTAVPGVAMIPTQNVPGYTHKYSIILEGTSASSVKACFNDGGSNWDNNNQKDYSLSEGVVGVKNGTVTDLTK